MSNILYNFLTESPLFVEKYISDNYKSLNKKRLKKELRDYREYVIKNLNSLKSEINNIDSNLKIQIESYHQPSKQLLKQLALYMDKIIINDPLFSFTYEKSEASQAAGKYLGLESEGVNKKKLAESAKYMIELTPMVSTGVAKFIPLSYIHEPPDEIPMYFSENYFSDILPEGLLDWFHDQAKVYPMKKSENGEWVYSKGNSLEPARGIAIEFEEHPPKKYDAGIYYLFEQEVVSYDEDERTVTTEQWLPDTPPDKEQFEAWVLQSINQFSRRVFDKVFNEVKIASQLESKYLTCSPFISNLLNMNLLTTKDFKTDIANLVLNLDLPVIGNTDLETLMKVRSKDGEVFENFRVGLEKNLRELRDINDPIALHHELENVEHEMSEVQINQINKKVREIKKQGLTDAVLLTGSLMTTIQTGGLSLIGVGAAIAKGYKTYEEYLSLVRENSSFFLWKLK